MVYYQLQGNIKRKTHHEYGLKVQKTYIQERDLRLSCTLKVPKQGHQLETIYAKNA